MIGLLVHLNVEESLWNNECRSARMNDFIKALCILQEDAARF